MRILSCFLITILLSNFSFAQNTGFDARLLEVYDISFLDRLEAQSPQALDLLTFELDNSFKIYNLVEDKKLVYNGVLDLKPSDSINILKLLKDEKVEQTQFIKKYYKLKNYEKVLVVFSKNEIVENYKKMQR